MSPDKFATDVVASEESTVKATDPSEVTEVAGVSVRLGGTVSLITVVVLEVVFVASSDAVTEIRLEPSLESVMLRTKEAAGFASTTSPDKLTTEVVASELATVSEMLPFLVLDADGVSVSDGPAVSRLTIVVSVTLFVASSVAVTVIVLSPSFASVMLRTKEAAGFASTTSPDKLATEVVASELATVSETLPDFVNVTAGVKDRAGATVSRTIVVVLVV